MFKSEVRIIRHEAFGGYESYSLGVVYGDDYTDNMFRSCSPEELQSLVDEAFKKPPVNSKIQRFSGENE